MLDQSVLVECKNNEVKIELHADVLFMLYAVNVISRHVWDTETDPVRRVETAIPATIYTMLDYSKLTTEQKVNILNECVKVIEEVE